LGVALAIQYENSPAPRPLSHFYAAMMNDVMRSDVIYVIGSGLGDLHLNSLIHEARSRNPSTPLVFVDYWKNGFEQNST
jgi:hypothetical protein